MKAFKMLKLYQNPPPLFKGCSWATTHPSLFHKKTMEENSDTKGPEEIPEEESPMMGTRRSKCITQLLLLENILEQAECFAEDFHDGHIVLCLRGFLEKTAYPLLEGSASFLIDYLIDGPGGYLETNPSTSPEHTFIAPDGKSASLSYSSTMDIAIIKEIFSAIVSAAEVLGITQDDLIQRVHKAKERLPPCEIARDDGLMEWVLVLEVISGRSSPHISFCG